MKPFIGINLDVRQGSPEQFFLNAAYSQAIQAAGGIPLIIAPMPDEDLTDLLRFTSAIIFSGGKDYDPQLYGSSPHEKLDPSHSWRQEFDIRLMHKCLHETNLPILGICAGHQLLNIALGGTLIQDLDSELESTVPVRHLGNDSTRPLTHHKIEFEKSSLAYSIFRSEQLSVPSSHHQAVSRLGSGLRVSSRAEDDVIESIELPGRGFTLGVQWHPERDYSGNSALFETFVAAAAGF